MKRLLIIAVLAVLAGPGLAGAGPGKLAPPLARALASADSPAWRADGTLAIWVHFAARDLTPAARDAALAAAAAALPERTLRRRGKMRAPGAALVDAGDLPLSRRHLDGVASTGARLRRQSRWLNAVSGDATAAQVAAIATLPYVKRIDLVARFRRPEPVVDPDSREAARAAMAAAREEASTWPINYGGSLAGLAQINVPAVHELGFTGEGVVIGMLDSGFKTTHEALADVTVLAQYDFLNDDPVVEDEAEDPSGQHSHGTRTLSAVVGFQDNDLVGPAFGASVILAKTEDTAAEYPLEEDVWVAGLEWVELQGADIVSSSLGYHDWYEFSDLDGGTAVTTIAADLAVARGLVVVNSAGNERGPGSNHIIAPADGDSVIAVGAVDLAGDLAGFSSPGPTYDGRIKPDVAAQGVANHVVSLVDDESYTTASGTSFSCPLVSGVAALVLSRAPTLTPLQVREALRETADRAHAPDNDFGWGVVDALAAVTYWGASIAHDPLPDSENTVAPFTIAARVTDRLPLDETRMHLFWRTGPGPWLVEPLQPAGGDLWQAVIPAQPAGTVVSYHFEVTDSAEITTRLPHAGADAPFAFAVGPDITPPVLEHTPLGTQPITIWPPVVTAMVTDNLGVGGVALDYSLNGGPEQGPFVLSGADAAYALVLPLEVAEVTVGDVVTYTLTAWDQAGIPNSAESGPHAFEIVDTLGRVVVLDDAGTPLADLKFDRQKQALPARPGGANAAAIAGWLDEAGYTTTVMAANQATPEDLAACQVIVLSAGDGTTPVADPSLRATLRDWALAGGRLLIEGGEIAYDALSSPGYDDFARDVLHAATWRGDSAGSLQRVVAQAAHPLLTRPYVLAPSIPVDYAGYGDQDVVDPTDDAFIVMDTAAYPGSAGILVHDDNGAPEAGQIVFLAFDLGALQPGTAQALVTNAVTYLLAPEPPPTASVAGQVLMADRSAPAGVTVTVDGDLAAVTGPDGRYVVAGLYGGAFTLAFVRDGYATVHREIHLLDGEQRAGVNVELRPALAVDALAAPYLAIPDDDPAGILSVIEIAATGAVADLSVDIDIQHPWIGDLSVRLVSPAGTQITLHDRTGGPGDDIVGNWPETLTVDGPGALGNFLGEEITGEWTLCVSDLSADAAGTLRTWGLHAVVPAPPTAADGPPPATRLLGARPNPFNPRTELVFELARAGPVRVDLYDLRGRLVRRLVAGELPAGRHRAPWDGRDEDGRGLASGVYLCRLAAAGVVEFQKLTLVR